jgi:hypothetical protein
MILGMTALGEGRPTGRQRFSWGVAHTIGGALGGIALALVVWILGTPVRTLAGGLVAAICAAGVVVFAVLLDLGVIRWRDRTGQVDPYWRARFGPRRSFFFYGAVFGFGWLTVKPSAVFYSATALLGLMLPLPEVLVGGALVGIGRTILVYPLSYRATGASCILSRGRWASYAWHRAGAAVSIASLVAIMVTAVS